MIRALRGEPVHNTEMVIAPQHGDKRYVQVTGQQLLNQFGQLVGAVVAMHDVTVQEQAETKLKHSNLQLQEANRELEAFSYSVSHDLRAPLRSIEGYANILLRDHIDRLDARAQELFGRIRANTVRMGQIIESLLNLSRLSRLPLRREKVDITAISHRIISDLRNADPDRPLNATVEAGLFADADPKLLRTVLENLIGNAWKFTRHASPAHIEVRSTVQDGKPVYYVRDNGVGFDMAYYNQLFTAFQRLHRSQEFDGFGIGLATVARIVHKHGGLVWAESTPGKGATFFFTVE